jgi:hypothetical protein
MFGFKRNTSPPTLRQDLRATKKSAIRTAFFVVLLISGVVPAFTFLFGGSGAGELSLTKQLSPLWNVFLHTYPLTLAIGVITYSRKQKWFRFGKWPFAAATIFLAATVSNSLGQLTGHAPIEPASIAGEYENPVFAIPATALNLFFGFYEQYGFAPFIASILVGMFAGSTASRLSRHVPKDVKSSAEGLVRDLVESQKRVA